MLFKRQKEQMEVLMHQQRLRKQLSDAAIKPRGDSSASKRVSSSVDERHTNRLSKALDAPAPMGAPPQPPLKSSISNDTSTTSASPAPPPKVEVTSGLPAPATPERVRGSGSTGDFPPTLPGDDTKNMAPRMIVDCSAWAYPKLDHLGLASTETSLLRLLCDPEFELIRCLGGLDTSKISVAGYRHLVTVAKIHDGAGTALEFLKNILQHNDYAMIVRAARAGTWWTYPRHSLDTGDSIANSVLDASCSNTVTLVLFKQILALEAKYFLEKVIGGIGSELQTQLKSAGAADALDMKMVSALVMKLFKDISTNRGLLSRYCRYGYSFSIAHAFHNLLLSHTRQLGRWLASRASMLLPLAVHDADADLANRLLAVVFLHGMIIPALRAPHEWNIAMPWDMKYVYRLYGTTHRDHASAVSSRLQSGTSAIPDQIDRVLTAVARLAGEVIGFITGSATDTMPAACHDELSMSMTLAASALCDQCELSIRDFLAHIGQESRVASGGGDSTTGAPVDAIGVLMLSQELDVFLADHVASSEHRILHWIDTHSREESVRADDMRVIAKAVESAPLEFEDACEEFVNANETGEDVVDERLPSSGNLQATAKARLSMLSRSIASQLRKL